MDLIADIAGELSRTDIRFYTGHCTGTPAYDIMKPIMGSKLEYVRAGTRISL